MKKIYLLAIAVSVFTLGLYVPRFYASAQEKAEQRKINQQILDLELELNDAKLQWQIMDDSKQELLRLIEQYSGDIANIEQTQGYLHTRADEIRKEIDILKGGANLNDELVNCYQWTGNLYNDCLDAVIHVGLQQRRQPQ